MNTEFEKKLITTLELIQHTATLAWWDTHGNHCGSDFNPDSCEPCFGFEQCKRDTELTVLFAELHKAVD